MANIKKNTLLVGKLELEDNSETIERIPFNLVEEITLFSKCNNVPLIKQSKCFETQIAYARSHSNVESTKAIAVCDSL